MAAAPDWQTAHAYAHRGLHDASVPENSLAAFEGAIAKGLGIECDLRVSRDGRAMVFHDAELDRLTGAVGTLAQLTVGELTGHRLGDSDEHIPTLRDMLKLVAGRAPLLLELKTDRRESVHKLCRAVRRDLEGYGGKVAVMSFDPRVSAWFAKRMPHMPRGLVVTEEDRRTIMGAIKRRLSVVKARPQFLAYDIGDLPSRFASAQAKAGLPLLTWTVRDGDLLERARSCDAAPIIEGDGVAAWESAS